NIERMTSGVRMPNSRVSDPVSLAVSLHGGQVLIQLSVIGQILQHLCQGHNTDYWHLIITLHYLDRRKLALPPLLPIEGDQHPGSLGILGLDDLHDFTDGGTGGDHVIYDQHAPGQRRADQAAAFAVILGYLAVDTPRQLA